MMASAPHLRAAMATKKVTGCTLANNRGKELESRVAALLEDSGYENVHPIVFPMRIKDQPIYAKHVEIGRDIYGKVRRCDLLVYNRRVWPSGLVIQCKWQASSGSSMEEKYPFEVLNIQKDEYPTIVVLDGGGYSKGSETWLKGQAGKNRLLHVFSFGELQKFASKGKL